MSIAQMQLLLHTGERARRVRSGAAMRALLLRRCRSYRLLLDKEECLDGIPLGLGHGLQGHGVRAGRNRHLGVILNCRWWGGAILLLRPSWTLAPP